MLNIESLQLRIQLAWAVLFLLVALSGSLDAQNTVDELTDKDFAEKRVAILVRQLSDQSVATQFSSLRQLRLLGPEARPATTRLIELFESDAADRLFRTPFPIKDAAQLSLSALGVEFLPTMEEMYADLPSQSRRLSRWTVRKLGFDGHGFLPVFRREFEDENIESKPEELATLAVVDSTGEIAFPILLQALDSDDDEKVRVTAAGLLKRGRLDELFYWEEQGPAEFWFNDPSDPRIEVASNALRKALKDDCPKVRAIAAYALATYPESSEKTVPLLLTGLSDHGEFFTDQSDHVAYSNTVAGAIAETLGNFGDHADQILPIMFSRSLNPDAIEFYNNSIDELLGQSQHPLEWVDTILKTSQPNRAFLALMEIENAPKRLIMRIEELQFGNEGEADYDQALLRLERDIFLFCLMPGEHAREKERIHSALQDKETRPDVCRLVSWYGHHASPLVPMLGEVLKVDDRWTPIDRDALRALTAIGPEAATTARIIINHMGRVGVDYSDSKEDALVAMGRSTVPHIIEALNAEQKSIRFEFSALRVFRLLGTEAEQAIPTVEQRLTSPYPYLRCEAVLALASIGAGDPNVLNHLIEATNDPRVIVREAAIQSLASFTESSEEVVPVLIKALEDDFLTVRVAAIKALKLSGKQAADASKKLTSMRQTDQVVKHWIDDTLNAISK